MQPARLTRITLTGADEKTSLTGALALWRCAPPGVELEIGLLYSANPEGRRRYPPLAWLRAAVARLGPNCAVHVCGREARRSILAGEQRNWISDAGRIQINGAVTADELARAVDLFCSVITQHNGHGCNVTDLPIPRHSILVDASGGRGIEPANWRRPLTPKPVGFAGGLGPANLRAQLPKIHAVAEGDYWIDMESSLRRKADDWFSLTLAQDALAACRAALRPAGILEEG